LPVTDGDERKGIPEFWLSLLDGLTFQPEEIQVFIVRFFKLNVV